MAPFRPSSLRTIFDGPAIAAVLFALLGGFFVYYPLADTDIWWHLASGREMLSQGRLLSVDPFSFTPHYAQWVNLHWLFQLLALAVYSLAGIKGLLLMKSGLIALVCAIVAIVNGRRHAWIGAGIAALLMFEARFLIDVRPVVLTLLFMATFIWCLERFTSTGRYRFLWALVPLQILWVNSQGLFALGPAIAGAYWIGEIVPRGIALRWPKLLTPAQSLTKKQFIESSLLFAGVIAACFVNPYGWHGIAYPLRLFERIDPSLHNIYSLNISENAPLASLLSGNPRLVAGVMVTVLAGLVSFVLNRKAARAPHMIVFAGFFGLAAMAQRNIPLFFLIAAPIIAGNLAASLPGMVARRTNLRRAGMMASVAAMLMFLSAAAVAQTGMLARCPRKSTLSPFCHPFEAVGYLRLHPVPGNIFNSIRFGGHLLWELYPPRQVFIDGRLITRSKSFFAEYLTLLDAPHYFAPVAARFGITHVLLQTALFYRELALARELYADPAWRLVFADGSSALFVIDSLASTPRLVLDSAACAQQLRSMLDERWRNAPAIRDEAVTYLGDFMNAVGAFRGAEVVLQGTTDPRGKLALAQSLYRQEKLDEAAALASILRREHPSDTGPALLLARICYAKKDYRQALENVIFVLKVEPFNEEARQLVALMQKPQ
jgi:hypothetical protein